MRVAATICSAVALLFTIPGCYGAEESRITQDEMERFSDLTLPPSVEQFEARFFDGSDDIDYLRASFTLSRGDLPEFKRQLPRFVRRYALVKNYNPFPPDVVEEWDINGRGDFVGAVGTIGERSDVGRDLLIVLDDPKRPKIFMRAFRYKGATH